MIFFTIFTFFLALVSASVISKGPGRSPFAQLSTRQSINDCDVGYYEDRTDDKSPFIADCETLITKLKHGTCYLILNGEYKQIAQYKSCAVGIVSADCENSHSFSCSVNMDTAKIGNEDVTGVIHNAIAIAKRDGRAGAGKVGAVGVFNCQIELMGDDTGRVKWSIFWNPYPEKDPKHPYFPDRL
ncbi:putative necrosis-inducing factor-domain-containing protein [Schizothecium vesticola]|uniref:Necrosis-inducing factor-domain-containing protein n=1 Tax=Schizothecium vesticola TaxID=314040 RepID=A0AA40F636_9PEZI|nr:putative necrosis-inducing factor-domain-containing protein [Schizothecium vesticola]